MHLRKACSFFRESGIWNSIEIIKCRPLAEISNIIISKTLEIMMQRTWLTIRLTNLQFMDRTSEDA
jgi:hypothetical protein